MIVPPRGRIPETSFGPRSRKRPSTRPRQPSSTPTHCQPCGVGGPHDGADDRIQAGAVAASRQDPDGFRHVVLSLTKVPRWRHENRPLSADAVTARPKPAAKDPSMTHPTAGAEHPPGSGAARHPSREARADHGRAAGRGARRPEGIGRAARQDRRRARLRSAGDDRAGARDPARRPAEDGIRICDGVWIRQSGSPVAISAPPPMISAPPVSSTAVKKPRVDLLATVDAPPVAPPEADSLRSELSHASAETERLRADNERLAQLRGELEQRLAAESQRAASLERELAAAKESGAAGRSSTRVSPRRAAGRRRSRRRSPRATPQSKSSSRRVRAGSRLSQSATTRSRSC